VHDAAFMLELASMSAPARAYAYWKRLRLLTLAMLLCWVGVTLAVPWFAGDLNAWRIGRFPLGFWLSSQGALMMFVLFIIVYVLVVEKMDAAWHAAQAHRQEPAASTRAGLARDDAA
jgi:putative solute:sodium symporter small subunit